MDWAQLISVLAQIGFGAGAWRLAAALKGRVDNHEVRITHHEVRITRLESI